MNLCYLLIFVFAILQENILPTSGHCCHPCIREDFSMFNSNGPLKSCSVECSGKLIKDGRCGSDDVSIESIFNQMTRYWILFIILPYEFSI